MTRINRRALRRKLGTRSNRRANTKSPVVSRDRTGKITRKLKPRPSARVSQLIEDIRNGKEE